MLPIPPAVLKWGAVAIVVGLIAWGLLHQVNKIADISADNERLLMENETMRAEIEEKIPELQGHIDSLATLVANCNAALDDAEAQAARWRDAYENFEPRVVTRTVPVRIESEECSQALVEGRAQILAAVREMLGGGHAPP